MTIIEKAILLVLALILMAIGASAGEERDKRAQFMESCLRDKKQYECDVLYGQANPKQASHIFWMPFGR